MNAQEDFMGETELRARLKAQEKTIKALMDTVERQSSGDIPSELLSQNLSLEQIVNRKTETLRQRAEERLRENYDLLNNTQQLTKVGGWEWDIVKQKMSWTNETFRIHGLTPEEFEAGSSEPIQRSIACYDPEFSPVIKAAFQHCVEEGEPYELECLITAVGGHHKWISTTGHPVIKDGKIIKVIGNIADITERKLAENLIRTHEHYLDTILQTSADGFLVLDRKGKVIEVNDAYCRMSGYTRDEILGLSVTDLDQNEGSIGFAARIKDIISKGSALFESRHCRKDGSLLSVEVSVTWLEENGGQLISFCRDLTERKRAEEERQRLQEQLFQSQKMESVGRLAGGVAHDFNNMLGAILGHAELAMMKLGEDEVICDDLKEIVFAANRSADITRQLLAFARKQIVLPKVLDLNQRVEEMLKMIRRLIGEDIDLLWLPGMNLWPLKMDPSQINQILVNLCVNARDAIAGAGKITIETGMVTFDAGYCAQHADFVPGDFLLLAVSDNGRGMDRKTLNKLFEPFFTTKELGKGTGLGLATVYGIVKQNQGFINVYSESGRGTTFNIYLPSHKELMVDAKSEQKTDLERGCETILLVEDELVILKMATMMLESLGYTVLATDNPSQACALARAHVGRIHLLITDVIMPLMNGRELAQQVLSLCPDIKCLFMSGYTANVIARHGVLTDGVQFLAKPFSMNDIAIKVRQVLDEK